MSEFRADFIIVGLGAAGAVVLRMLSDKGYNVIGIEAGGNHDNDPLIFDSQNALSLESAYTWKFFYNQETKPNPDIVLSNGNNLVLNYTTGRLNGGGTSINGMQYVRSPDDYWNEWGAINGPNWNAKAASKAYKKLEKFQGVPKCYNSDSHGFEGKMQIRQAPEKETVMATKFATALAKATSSPIIKDYNDPSTPIGTFTRWSLFQQPNGIRASSSTNFLEDIIDTNGKSLSKYHKVRVLQNTTVNKVIFNGNKAIGVEAIRNGQTIIIKSKLEVILSSGIHSNEILQRSGIGDGKLLKSLNIPVIFDNPNVGVGSRNHLISSAVFSVNPKDYPGTGKDPDSLYTGGAFLPNPDGTKERGFQWIGINSPPSDTSPSLLTVVFYNLNPESFGTDQIQDKDPLRVSAVAENLMSNPIDLQRIVDVYQKQIIPLNNEFIANYPGYKLLQPSLDIINNKNLLEQYIKDNLDHAHHWTGTVKMDSLSNGGVVNNKGKVYGAECLRVADISVAPVQPRGNTAGPAFSVGQIISDQIIQEYSCSTSF